MCIHCDRFFFISTLNFVCNKNPMKNGTYQQITAFEKSYPVRHSNLSRE